MNKAACARAAADPALLATDLADYLVRKGVAFREAHHAVGSLVAAAEKAGKPLRIPFAIDSALPREEVISLSLTTSSGIEVRQDFTLPAMGRRPAARCTARKEGYGQAAAERAGAGRAPAQRARAERALGSRRRRAPVPAPTNRCARTPSGCGSTRSSRPRP
ncbi:MAG TPA: hypothetical protein PK072_17970 [Quisquiliibacterium sp.]|nr:hypothetical protein [Quisquiliibacterium sp.]